MKRSMVLTWLFGAKPVRHNPAPAVAPPITHKVVTKWTPISHNELPEKTGKWRRTPGLTPQRCGFVPPTPGYAPCTREPHSDGPCAHPLLKVKVQPRSALYHFVAARARCAVLSQDEGLSFDIFVEATRRRDAIARFTRSFPEFVFTELNRAKP
jgi:hypothetical protein